MKSALLIFISSFALILNSCKEDTRVNLISGKVFENCDVVAENIEIALKANVGGSFNNPIILGSGITSSDGTLNFTYELEKEDVGTGSLLYIKSTGFENLLTDVTLNEDFNQNFYRIGESKLEISISGNAPLQPIDTLYYGITNHQTTYSKVQPNYGIVDTALISRIAPNQQNDMETFYFGIGWLAFNRAKSSASNADSTFNKMEVSLNTCGTISKVWVVLD